MSAKVQLPAPDFKATALIGEQFKEIKLSEARSLQFRLETFNTFNHAQFFGPAAVDGDLDSNLFGQVVKAAPPRLEGQKSASVGRKPASVLPAPVSAARVTM